MSASPKKAKKPAKKSSHPPYNEMVAAAVIALKDRKGSSRVAIDKYIQSNYKVGDNHSSHLKMALKRMSLSGALVHTKGAGASGSFKIKKVEGKPKKKKSATTKKPAAKKATTPKKKKPAAKKTKTPKKTAKPKAVKKTKKASPKKKKPAKKTAKK